MSTTNRGYYIVQVYKFQPPHYENARKASKFLRTIKRIKAENSRKFSNIEEINGLCT